MSLKSALCRTTMSTQEWRTLLASMSLSMTTPLATSPRSSSTLTVVCVSDILVVFSTVCVSHCQSVCPTLSVCVSHCLSACGSHTVSSLSVCLSLTICLSVCLSLSVSHCLSVCPTLSVCVSHTFCLCLLVDYFSTSLEDVDYTSTADWIFYSGDDITDKLNNFIIGGTENTNDCFVACLEHNNGRCLSFRSAYSHCNAATCTIYP